MDSKPQEQPSPSTEDEKHVTLQIDDVHQEINFTFIRGEEDNG